MRRRYRPVRRSQGARHLPDRQQRLPASDGRHHLAYRRQPLGVRGAQSQEGGQGGRGAHASRVSHVHTTAVNRAPLQSEYPIEASLWCNEISFSRSIENATMRQYITIRSRFNDVVAVSLVWSNYGRLENSPRLDRRCSHIYLPPGSYLSILILHALSLYKMTYQRCYSGILIVSTTIVWLLWCHSPTEAALIASSTVTECLVSSAGASPTSDQSTSCQRQIVVSLTVDANQVSQRRLAQCTTGTLTRVR